MNLRKLLCGLLALCLLLTMAPAALMEEAPVEEVVVELGGEEVAAVEEAPEEIENEVDDAGDAFSGYDREFYENDFELTGNGIADIDKDGGRVKFSIEDDLEDYYIEKVTVSSGSTLIEKPVFTATDVTIIGAGKKAGKAKVKVLLYHLVRGSKDKKTFTLTINVYDANTAQKVKLYNDEFEVDSTMTYDVTDGEDWFWADVLPEGVMTDVIWKSSSPSVAKVTYWNTSATLEATRAVTRAQADVDLLKATKKMLEDEADELEDEQEKLDAESSAFEAEAEAKLEELSNAATDAEAALADIDEETDPAGYAKAEKAVEDANKAYEEYAEEVEDKTEEYDKKQEALDKAIQQNSEAQDTNEAALTEAEAALDAAKEEAENVDDDAIYHNARIEFLKKGTATITATANAGNKKASFKIKVTDKYAPTKVSIASGIANVKYYEKLDEYSQPYIVTASTRVGVGDEIALIASVDPAGLGHEDKVTWSLSNSKAVLESKKGEIVGLKGKTPGKVKVTAKTHNGKKATVTITVVDPNTPSAISFYAYDEFDYAETGDVTKVAGIERDLYNELLTERGEAKGDTKVNYRKPSITVATVYPEITTASKNTLTNWSLNRDQYANLKVSTDNKKVAKVSGMKYDAKKDSYYFTVTAVGKGTCNITVKTKDGKVSAKLPVRITNDHEIVGIEIINNKDKVEVGSTLDLDDYIILVAANAREAWGEVDVAPSSSYKSKVSVDKAAYTVDVKKSGTILLKVKANGKSAKLQLEAYK